MPRPSTAGGAPAFAFALLAASTIMLGSAAAQGKKEAPHPAEILLPDEGFELKPEQRERLAKLIPNSLARLEKRQPMHIVALGDSVTRYVSHDEHDGDTHRSYAGVFAAELAKLFFYTGGVRDLFPIGGQPDKALAAAGPEITIQNLGLRGRVGLHGLGRASGDAFVNKPTLMTMSYGINDSAGAINLSAYLRAFEQSAAYARAAGCDVMFLGPNTVLDTGADLSKLALTQKYASALESLAQRLGVFYFDLGSVTARGRGVVADTDDEAFLTAYNTYRRDSYHTHVGGGEVDTVHPSEDVQTALGRSVYAALLDAPAPRYRVGGSVTLDGKGGFALEFKLKNLTETDLSGRVFPMPFGGFAPAVTSVPFETRAGKGVQVAISYQPAGGDDTYRLDGAEPFLRVPLLVADSKRSLTVSVVADLHPFAPVWALGATGDLKNSTGGEFTVISPRGASGTASGQFGVTWIGESSRGSFTAGTPTGFSFPLPSGGGADLRRGSLDLALNSGGKTYRFARGLEVSRHHGLGAAVPLVRADQYASTGESSTGRGVTVRATANASGITVTHDIAVPISRADPDSAPYQIEIQFDARAYGKRRNFGFVDFVRFIPLDDGTVKTSALRPSVFGNGYNRNLDKTQLKTTRQRLPGGGERFSVTIPRSYFYLHEWALGNGNSLLGFNAFVRVQTAASGPGMAYPPSGTYHLVDPSGMSRFNAESLGVLELTERPTSRWTSRLY